MLPRPTAAAAAARALPRLAPAAIALACSLALQTSPARAQSTLSVDPDANPGTVPLRSLDARVRIGGESVHLPQGEHMGLVGLTELLNVGGEWWVGPGVYGAATGKRGGLFVPGVEGAWSHPFNDWLAVDTGLFAGGGGGAAAPVGGGLMLRPHLDLVFRFPGFYTGPTFSKVWFTSGNINSNQVGWMLNFDSSFRYRPAAFTGAATDGSATGLGFDHVDAMVTIAHPRNSVTTAGTPLTQTIGLVGFGNVGHELVPLVRPLGFRVVGVRRQSGGSVPPGVDRIDGITELDRVLAESDHVVLSLPLTPETRGLLDAARFARFKPGAIFHNIARGGLIDEAALLANLQSGHLGGAALDVFDREPLADQSPFWDLPNVLITPHIAGHDRDLGVQMLHRFRENLRAYLTGRPVAPVANFARGY